MEEQPQPELVNNNPVDRRIFVDLLEGIVLSDPAEVIHASHVAEQLGTPFTGSDLIDAAHRYENLVHGNYNDKTRREQLRLAEGIGVNVLRAYVYSGVPVERNLVLLTIARLGMSERTLKWSLVPNLGLFHLISCYEGREPTETEKFTITWRGLTALEELGLLRWTTSFPLKIDLRIMNRELNRQQS